MKELLQLRYNFYYASHNAIKHSVHEEYHMQLIQQLDSYRANQFQFPVFIKQNTKYTSPNKIQSLHYSNIVYQFLSEAKPEKSDKWS